MVKSSQFNTEFKCEYGVIEHLTPMDWLPDGVILTKLDGTARGGIVFPLFNQLGIPVKFLGVGEDLTDLELFDPESYVDGLLGIGEDL